eukprot:gene2360-5319_t
MEEELRLTPIEYIQVGNLHRKTLGIVPSTSGRTEKIIIGDRDGVVTCFGSKKQQAVVLFRTLGGPPIHRLSVFGDRTFVAAGTEVRGYSKKGKNFFTMSTYMTEDIQTMCVDHEHLHIAGDYLYTHLVDAKPAHSYMAADVIRDMVLISLPTNRGSKRARKKDLQPVLACGDRSIRVLEGSDVAVYMDLPEPPECMCTFANKYTSILGQVLVGTSSGSILLVELGIDGHDIPWIYNPSDVIASVTALTTAPITDTKASDVVVGRSDGTVEVYTFGSDNTSYDSTVPPIPVFTTSVNSAITSLCCGYVHHRTFPEEDFFGCDCVLLRKLHILCLHFEIQLGSHHFHECEPMQQIVVATYSGHIIGFSTDPDLTSQSNKLLAHSSNRDKIDALQVEIEELQRELASPMTYQSTIPALPDVDVLCRANVPLDLLDVQPSTAIASFTSTHEDGSSVLATYRCQSGTTALDVRLRSIEGQHGSLNVYIIPQTSPKVAHRTTLLIKALGLHERWHQPVDPSMKGSGLLRSDNLSTIAIVKDIISSAATSRNIQIDIHEDIDPKSCSLVLTRLAPKIEKQLELIRKVELITALKELEVQEGGRDALRKDHQDILAHSSELLEEHESNPCQLERLFGIITDLFIDKCRAMGVNGKAYLPALTSILHNFDYNALTNFFDQSIGE